MFVNNGSHHRPALARTLVSTRLAVAAVVVRSVWRISAAALLPWEGPRIEVTEEPGSTSEHALWHGTSVTVSGNVRGPGRPPYVARVDLDVGAERRSLLVHGDRRWIRNAGRLAVGSAAPFDHKPLSWMLAFGGGYALAPGLDPVSKRPHPGGWMAHVLNPGGTGLYGDEGVADGAPLPNIERPEEPIASWRDQPRPAGLSPCPSLHGLRAPVSLPRDDPDWHVRAALRLLHPGPGELIFEPLRPGVRVRVAGLAPKPLELDVPPSPVRVLTVRGETRDDVPFHVRWIHVDGDGGVATVDHAHAFSYEPTRAPSWVRVENSGVGR